MKQVLVRADRLARRYKVIRMVRISLRRYGTTLKLLHKYDQGRASATKFGADYRRLRDRLYQTE